MTDTPTVPERYGSATSAGVQANVVAAVAWSDRELAALLFRARIGNDPAAVRDLRTAWPSHVERMAARRVWTMKVPAVTKDNRPVIAEIGLPLLLIEEVARRSLDHWLLDVCPSCKGRGFRLQREVLAEAGKLAEAMETGRDVLSDHRCRTCNGMGRLRLEAPLHLAGFVAAAVESLDTRYKEAAHRAKRRL